MTKTKNEDIIWIKIKKEFYNEPEDIYLASLYLNPVKGKNENFRRFLQLSNEIMSFQKKGNVILVGDLNARTNNTKDYIELDKFSDDLSSTNDETITLIRNSEDKMQCDHTGKELLDLCKTHDLRIVNGRKTGDLFGKFTSFQPNGNGVVDYLISESNIFEKFSFFKVGEYIPWLSDHCALHSCIQLNEDMQTRKSIPDLKPAPKIFKWDKNSNRLFTENLNSNNLSNRLNYICQQEILDSNAMALEITKLLIDTAKTANIKTKKIRPHSKNKIWFDRECEASKLHLKNLGKQANIEIDSSLRKEIGKQKKHYKNMIKKKKMDHQKGIVEKMNSESKDGKVFWNLLDKLDYDKNSSDHFKNTIPSDKWVNYFKGILNTNKKQTLSVTGENTIGPLDFEITTEEMKEAAYVLRPGKSPGLDSISNEMIACLLEHNPYVLLKLFNSILHNTEKISIWNTGMINPIHKKGSFMNTGNYRRISLLSCLGN